MDYSGWRLLETATDEVKDLSVAVLMAWQRGKSRMRLAFDISRAYVFWISGEGPWEIKFWCPVDPGRSGGTAEGGGSMSVIDEIAAERRRQIKSEGWTPEHDDEHSRGELVRAACSYAYEAGRSEQQHLDDFGCVPPIWPWESGWCKPTTSRRDLIKAAALIVAEIERLDRAAKPSSTP